MRENTQKSRFILLLRKWGLVKIANASSGLRSDVIQREGDNVRELGTMWLYVNLIFNSWKMIHKTCVTPVLRWLICVFGLFM